MYSISTGKIDNASVISNIIQIANFENKDVYRGINKGVIKDSMFKGDLYFIMFFEDEPIGVISLSNIKSYKPTIKRFALLPRFQKKGLGVKLLNHVEKISKEYNKYKIFLGVNEDKRNLVKWYQHNGFTITDIKLFKKYKSNIIFMSKCL